VARRGEEAALGRDLDDAAEVHHRHAVGHVLHHREVVRDEQVGEPEAALQFLQQVHHLRLDGDIERAHRLIADDEFRSQAECARDADALALAAGEFMREPRRVEGREAHQGE